METTLKKSKKQQTLKKPPIHKSTNPKHQEDYVFLEKPDDEQTALKLISGPFASIVYKYGNVGFAPESEAVDGALPMRFDYTVIENHVHDFSAMVDAMQTLLSEQRHKMEAELPSAVYQMTVEEGEVELF